MQVDPILAPHARGLSDSTTARHTRGRGPQAATLDTAPRNRGRCSRLFLLTVAVAVAVIVIGIGIGLGCRRGFHFLR